MTAAQKVKLTDLIFGEENRELIEMTSEYKYRPPVKYLVSGLSGIIGATIFSLAIGADSLWLSLASAFFCLAMAAMFFYFLPLFVLKFNSSPLRIQEEQEEVVIEIPGRWKGPSKILFSDIKDIGEIINSYECVIQIWAKDRVYLIEKNWMREKDYETVVYRLMDWAEKNLDRASEE